ncbi:response regulator [Roseomonas sp. NAR14]|uniref:Response regulator n=1 Tax=Roseomonas acroporae TaxID=2937791 RepID=A0A9X1YB47_9PROT|nr:response regulator [Roseomonas acroporae]MCK8786203.1 response regulator [Roseomonas acroporae]
MAQPLLLVVEDDPLVRATLVDALNDGGFEVLEAEDASTAMGLLRTRPDIVALLTDINLADGPDGFELAEAARRLRPALPVLYASGRYAEPVVERCVPSAVFLAKPFAPATAVDTLHRLIAASRSPDWLHQAALRSRHEGF